LLTPSTNLVCTLVMVPINTSETLVGAEQLLEMKLHRLNFLQDRCVQEERGLCWRLLRKALDLCQTVRDAMKPNIRSLRSVLARILWTNTTWQTLKYTFPFRWISTHRWTIRPDGVTRFPERSPLSPSLESDRNRRRSQPWSQIGGNDPEMIETFEEVPGGEVCCVAKTWHCVNIDTPQVLCPCREC
jgi:hypothetical protein